MTNTVESLFRLFSPFRVVQMCKHEHIKVYVHTSYLICSVLNWRKTIQCDIFPEDSHLHFSYCVRHVCVWRKL